MKYSRAPITEAVMDIRIQPRDDLSVDDLRELSKGAGEEFVQANEQYRLSAVVAPGSPTTQTTTSTKVGFQFQNAAGDKLVQAQIDGWSFSKLTPHQRGLPS
jgi:uncharacterized protein (TIGR04255 family)